MDIVSYSKAMQGRKNLDALNKRLGVGDYKSGDKDIKGAYVNVKTRLDELEKKRQGLLDREILIDTKEDFGKGTFTDCNASEGVLVLNSVPGGEGTVNLIPPMTSNTTPSGVAYASAELATGPAWKAFNGTVSSWEDRWFVETFLKGSFLAYTFDAPVTISAYDIYPVIGDNGLEIPRSPKDFKLFAKNEGTEWVELDSRIGITDWTGGVPKRFSLQNQNAYQYYQLIIHANNGDKALEIGELKMFGPSLTYVERGGWISNEMDLGDDFLELSGIEVVGTGKYKVFTKTNADKGFVEVTGKTINSRHGQKVIVKVQLEKGEVLPTVDSIKINFKNRPLSDRISEIEANIHANLNKHNLRISALLDKKRYKLKDMIMDDFGDDKGIDKEHSTNLTYDKENHKVKQTDAQTSAILTTVKEQADTIPEFILISAMTGEDEGIELYASRDSGVTWMQLKPNVLMKMGHLPTGKEIIIKAILRDGQELHAMSYSWI
ncbi:hypothetical protein [Bacillus mobilis]|uniref:hypothetical protein n=1 Tax=Bacillus mobilis TaxID=2026190 RepID=UPI00369EE0BE